MFILHMRVPCLHILIVVSVCVFRRLCCFTCVCVFVCVHFLMLSLYFCVCVAFVCFRLQCVYVTLVCDYCCFCLRFHVSVCMCFLLFFDFVSCPMFVASIACVKLLF